MNLTQFKRSTTLNPPRQTIIYLLNTGDMCKFRFRRALYKVINFEQGYLLLPDQKLYLWLYFIYLICGSPHHFIDSHWRTRSGDESTIQSHVKCHTTHVRGFVRVVSTVIFSITHPEMQFAEGIIAKELICSTYISSFILKQKRDRGIQHN